MVTVDAILSKPFSERTKSAQKQIILDGKPTPNLSGRLPEGIELNFNSFYEKEVWLTACYKRATFYCWSCLLFAKTEKTVWTNEGFSDYINLQRGIKEHNCSIAHIGALVKLQVFLRENTENANPRNEERSAEAVKKLKRRNELFKRMLHVMCCVASQTLCAPKNVNNFQMCIINKCTEALNLFKNYEDKSMERAIDYLTSLEKLTSYIKTLAYMVNMVIKEEIFSSNYVSLIQNEHSSNESVTRVSIVVRYLKNGKVFERFLGFYYLCKPDNKEPLISPMQQAISVYGIGDKLLAFSYDSALESLADMQNLICVMQEEYKCLFVPCNFHSFETVIERSLSFVDVECHHFFKTISSMKSCLSNSSKMRREFNRFMGGKVHDLDFDLQKGFQISNFKFVGMVKSNRIYFVNFFQSVVDNHKEWIEDDVIKAVEFNRALKDFPMVFLLETFSMLSNLVVAVSDILSGSSPENIFERRHYENGQSFLCSMKKNEYTRLYHVTCSQIFDPNVEQKDINIETLVRPKFHNIFNKIIDRLIGEMKIRIEPLEELSFFQLLSQDPKKRSNFRIFSTKMFSGRMQNITKNYIRETQLHNELNDIEMPGSLFRGKTVHKIMEVLTTETSQSQFKNIYKLAEVILTMPCKPASVDENAPSASAETKVFDSRQRSPISLLRNLSELDKINDWPSSPSSENLLITNDWNLLTIEHGILSSLMSQDQFYSDFISTFRRLNPMVKLVL